MMESMALPLALRDMILAQSVDRDKALPAMGEEEFRLFYDRTARPLWSYLARITGDRTRADDFLQEAFYRFYRAGAQHENETHRRNSLFQIATNLVRDAARRNARYPEVPVDDQMPSSHHGRVDEQVTTKTDVQRAMSRLQPAQREILWLAYAQGSSHDEIAEILGIRSISVRTILLRARRKLAALLTEDAR
jgi:RNA polymerase sigma-70 factor (ECF subfamily)